MAKVEGEDGQLVIERNTTIKRALLSTRTCRPQASIWV